ncbi:recombinase family protein [Xanthobacter flavus]|uniref:recombinase family protein n=1 Tax=Xanthobacter flavus TaxID=281 RepID=UPI001AE74F02|nr:DNA invertase Pin-like site-specific DNA recombinase [Xanthobacter flavus]
MNQQRRAGVYARFSSDKQDGRSIEDQAALCAAYAERQGWVVAEVYSGFAVSGASVHGRFAFERLVQDARRGAFDVILTEDLDRLSRNQADIAALYERMTFAGVEIWTVADGRVSEMHVGLKGTMSALFLRNLALKTHRGLQGRIREGKSAGGRCFGYRVAGTGVREIHDGEAEVVRRIFTEFADGSSPREIVARLNAEGVTGPRGGQWNASTINGSRERANGIIRNELYAGRLVWNRQRFVKDPDTGKRVSRPNAAGARHVVELPELRIVPPELWDQVQRRLTGRGPNAPMQRKPRHLLSGLCRCGACGGSFIVAAPNKLGCSTRREKGTCDNRRLISLKMLEQRILGALQEHLLHPEVLERVTAAYLAERRRLRANSTRAEAQRLKRLGEIERETTRIVDTIAKTDLPDPTALVARLNALTAEAKALQGKPEGAEPEVIEFHPAIVSRYSEIVRKLRAEIESRPAEERAPVIEMARRLIERVVIFPNDDVQGRDLELHGTLAALLGATEGDRDSMGRMVAGARNHLKLLFRAAA